MPGTHGKGGPGAIVQEEPLLDRWSRRDDGRARSTNERPRRKKAATSEEGEEIRHDFGKTVELEIERFTVGSSTGLREMSDWTLCRSRPPPKRKKMRQKHSPREIKTLLSHLGRLTPCEGTTREERLKGGTSSRLGKEGESDHRRHKDSLGKKKYQYASIFFGTNNLKEEEMSLYHVDSLLGNGRERSKCTKPLLSKGSTNNCRY
jgi:hypothetical protein